VDLASLLATGQEQLRPRFRPFRETPTTPYGRWRRLSLQVSSQVFHVAGKRWLSAGDTAHSISPPTFSGCIGAAGAPRYLLWRCRAALRLSARHATKTVTAAALWNIKLRTLDSNQIRGVMSPAEAPASRPHKL